MRKIVFAQKILPSSMTHSQAMVSKSRTKAEWRSSWETSLRVLRNIEEIHHGNSGELNN